ncbi:FlgO family outer membrane protein [Kushneria aurantia]|uniref:FlgO family outer membrane protein n=1 Tax=Kushneria aurantia TaxID=504092 RepID=A0ABV6G309_9GAMM|nr:FlgO family outer membrane protein [Kushneria aurantia]
MVKIFKKQWAPLIAVLLATLLAGCTLLPGNNEIAPQPTLLSAVDDAADELLESARGRLSASDSTIATTFVDIDQLDSSSTLGRALSEALTSKLVAGGLNVMEVKLRSSLYIEERTGELILSRNVQQLGSNYDATAVLLGTYAVGRAEVLVNARLVRLADRAILGATSFRIPLDANVQSLLATPYAY